MPILLETDRLILRPPVRSDAAALVMVADNPAIAATMMDFPSPFTMESAIDWIDMMSVAHIWVPDFKLAMFLKETGQPIGGVFLVDINNMHRKAELSYWLGVDYWRKGFTTEAARRLVEYGFEEMNLYRIVASCMAKNVASRRVMEKVGMTYEGTGRGDILKDGIFEDMYDYGILRPEWHKQNNIVDI